MSAVRPVAGVHAVRVAVPGAQLDVAVLGAGPPVLVVGGALRDAEDYLPLARVLARRFTVHVLDRRGHGASGSQGPDYSLSQEVDDLLRVQAAVGARAVFGHSFGGLVALLAASAGGSTPTAVYEPGVSVDGSLPLSWIPRYRHLLAAGRTRAAFAHFVRGSGHAPAVVGRLPVWYLRAVLRLVVRKARWARLEPLLSANLREHEALLEAGDVRDRCARARGEVLLLGGATSPAFATDTLRSLAEVIPAASVDLLDGLGHNAPDEAAPERVGERVLEFFERTVVP